MQLIELLVCTIQQYFYWDGEIPVHFVPAEEQFFCTLQCRLEAITALFVTANTSVGVVIVVSTRSELFLALMPVGIELQGICQPLVLVKQSLLQCLVVFYGHNVLWFGFPSPLMLGDTHLWMSCDLVGKLAELLGNRLVETNQLGTPLVPRLHPNQ